MIGREGPVDRYALIRWARAQAAAHQLSLLEAHVLLLLATYADKDAKCWPSVRRLAGESGLKVTSRGNNSAVSLALGRLQELQLIWTKQAGRGPSVRELLFNPQLFAEAKTEPGEATSADSGQPFATAKSEAPQPSGPALREERPQPFATAEAKYQRRTRTAEDPEVQLQDPDEALRQGEELQPSTSEKNGNGLTEEERGRLGEFFAERFPTASPEEVRRGVERLQRERRPDDIRAVLARQEATR